MSIETNIHNRYGTINKNGTVGFEQEVESHRF